MPSSSTGSLHRSVVTNEHFQSSSEDFVFASVHSCSRDFPSFTAWALLEQTFFFFFLPCLHSPSQQALQWPRKQGRTSCPDGRHRLSLPTDPHIHRVCRDHSPGHCLFAQTAHTHHPHCAHSTGLVPLQGHQG